MPLPPSRPTTNTLLARTESAHPQSDIVMAQMMHKIYLLSQLTIRTNTANSRIDLPALSARVRLGSRDLWRAKRQTDRWLDG